MASIMSSFRHNLGLLRIYLSPEKVPSTETLNQGPGQAWLAVMLEFNPIPSNSKN